MLFNSVTYLFVFLPAVALLHWRVPERLRLWLILIASVVFYGFWRTEFVPLLLLSAVLDYFLALWIEATADPVKRRRLMLISVAANLGILCFFKYLIFFRDTVWSVANWFGYYPSIVELHIILPLGISFYIFATISYVIDVYRQEFKAERNFVVYCCFVTFFPHLVAGPILRAGNLIPQLRKPAPVGAVDVRDGISRIIQGLFLKLVLADTTASFVDTGFARDASTLSAFDVWTLAILFGFQIYFDFAGYSHIAIGSARMFGIILPENFDFPYLAASPREFWRRWHISLSTWIRDYVYLSMVGSSKASTDRLWGGATEQRQGAEFKSDGRERQRSFSLYGTWALMGLWHGANWTFVIWGLYHAALVHAYRITAVKIPWGRGLPYTWVSRAITFSLMMAGWIPFRTQSTTQALVMWGKMVDPSAYRGFSLAPNSYFLAMALIIGMVAAWLIYTTVRPWMERNISSVIVLPVEVAFYTVMIMCDLVFLQSMNQFIYFQF
jgi:alginate O-acetyltransferase complex protein AlgI